jgi:hypothetical protein
MILETSQYSIENEFYMVDLPELLEIKAKQKNEVLLEKVLLQLATNNRSLPEDESKKYINNLTKQAGNHSSDTFDREKFEQLRMMTNMGANRTK